MSLLLTESCQVAVTGTWQTLVGGKWYGSIDIIQSATNAGRHGNALMQTPWGYWSGRGGGTWWIYNSPSGTGPDPTWILGMACYWPNGNSEGNSSFHLSFSDEAYGAQKRNRIWWTRYYVANQCQNSY